MVRFFPISVMALISPVRSSWRNHGLLVGTAVPDERS
jgi:hypothetical protein